LMININLTCSFSIDKIRLTASLMSRRHSLVENASIVKTVYTKDPDQKIKNIQYLMQALPGNSTFNTHKTLFGCCP